eukprot:EG_transcript_36991
MDRAGAAGQQQAGVRWLCAHNAEVHAVQSIENDLGGGSPVCRSASLAPPGFPPLSDKGIGKHFLPDARFILQICGGSTSRNASHTPSEHSAGSAPQLRPYEEPGPRSGHR